MATPPGLTAGRLRRTPGPSTAIAWRFPDVEGFVMLRVTLPGLVARTFRRLKRSRPRGSAWSDIRLPGFDAGAGFDLLTTTSPEPRASRCAVAAGRSLG